jgi:hypothetical protein
MASSCIKLIEVTFVARAVNDVSVRGRMVIAAPGEPGAGLDGRLSRTS